MLRSTYCILSDSNDRELADLGECPFDQVINERDEIRPTSESAGFTLDDYDIQHLMTCIRFADVGVGIL